MKRIVIASIIMVSFIGHSFGQNRVDSLTKQTMQLTLQEAIRLAQLQSLSSFKSKNMYLASYWDFRSYKASQLPGLSLTSTPIDYSRSVNQYYDANSDQIRFVSTETLFSDVGVSLNQNLVLTGGELSVNSDLRRLENVGSSTDFTSIPFSIRLSQPLYGYNSFRWASKLKPLEYEQAKKTYLADMEALAQNTVNYFFNTIGAHIDLKIAETNLANADTLFNIGKGRFNIGTVTQDELLDLELSFLNAKLEKTKAQVNLKQAQNLLNSFLGFDKDVVIDPLIPNEIPQLKINADEALELAKENNPDILAMEVELISAKQSVAQAKGTSGLSANLNANMGKNKTASEFSEVYNGPFQDDRGLSVSLSAPILDWGTRRGQIQMAKSNQQVTEAGVKQSMIDFEQNVMMQVLQFNMQEEQVKISAKADTVAQMGYKVTKQRFMIDKVDVIKLNAARTSLDQAKRAYLSALSNFWVGYYTIREITLYDFEHNESLIHSLDHLLEQ